MHSIIYGELKSGTTSWSDQKPREPMFHGSTIAYTIILFTSVSIYYAGEYDSGTVATGAPFCCESALGSCKGNGGVIYKGAIHFYGVNRGMAVP